MNLKILCVALCLMANYALGQDSWERYKPRALKQIIQQHEQSEPEALKAPGQENVFSIFSSDNLPSRVKVIYTGASRSVSAKKKEFLVGWTKSLGHKPEIADLFESELLFKEDSVEFWLPTQKQIIPHFSQELKKDDEVTLLLILAGAMRQQGRIDWVFLVNEFETMDQQPTAPQKSVGSAASPDPEIIRLMKEEIAREDAADLKGAIEISLKILQIAPRNTSAMNTIAGLFGKLGQFEQELDWTQKAIAIDPQFDLAYINMGNALAGLKRYNEAADAYKKAIQIDPKNPLGVYGLGAMEEDQGNFKKALECYLQSIQADSTFENGYFSLAAMYANLKQFDEAIDTLKVLILMNPRAEDAKAMLLEIEKGKRKAGSVKPATSTKSTAKP